MQSTENTQQKNWWAEGDTPVRTDSHVAYMVDGRATMLAMCQRYLTAQKYIYLGNWGLTPTMQLVRGSGHRAGPDGSAEQKALEEQLSAAGLGQAEIAFWNSHELTLRNVLGYAVSKGVEVKVLLWNGSPVFSVCDAKEAQQQLEAVGVTCLLDDSAVGIFHHPVESLHQKISIVDGANAFVGGIDPIIEHERDFDRWDTPAHPFSSPLRVTPKGTTPHPWHDTHALIEGPAAGDVEYNFRQRWNDLVQHHHLGEQMVIPEHAAVAPHQHPTTMQVARTIPEHTYHFQPMIVRGIAQLYQHAFSNIERFVYLENQYLWLRAYTGIDIPFVGSDSEEMKQNIRRLGEALRRGAMMSIILPDHPNVGRAFSDAGLQRLREEAPNAVEEGRLEAFCLATSTHNEEGEQHYRPIYVHAKVAIVDDLWSTVGSGNLNNRGMRDDTEMNLAVLDTRLSRGLRLMLQGEHLALATADELYALSRLLGEQYQTDEERERAMQTLQRLEQTIGDPQLTLRIMHNSAWENLRRYKAGRALIGHLLPYLTAEEAEREGLNFHGDHGWIEEPIPGTA